MRNFRQHQNMVISWRAQVDRKFGLKMGGIPQNRNFHEKHTLW